MKNKFPLLAAVFLISLVFFSDVQANDVFVTIEGRVVQVEPQKSIAVEIGKSKSIELSMGDIRSVYVLDPKKLTDGMGKVVAVSGPASGASVLTGVVDPPERLPGYDSNSKLKNAGIVGVITVVLSAGIVAAYNFLTKKPPMMIYSADNKNLNNVAVLNLLPIGVKVRVVHKNRINGTQ